MLRSRNSFSKIRLFSAVFLLYLILHFSPVPIRLSTSLILTNRSIFPSYIIRDPINITNDDGLAAVANSGTGTANDPYIIAEWNITGSPMHGISITGTTKHFRVENCWIHSSMKDGIYVESVTTGTTTIINNTYNNNGYAGISLHDSGSSIVANNTCNNNNDHGIYLGRHSGSSTLINNTCNNNGEPGINVYIANSTIIANNTCNDNGDSGIAVTNSGFSTVANNTCTNNGRGGISLGSSGSSTVANNTCISNNWGGISLENSDFSTVANNTFFNDGLHFEVYSKEKLLSYRVENNTINGLPLGYFKNVTNSTISETYGQLVLVNCHNMIVKNQYCSNTSLGIALYYCDKTQLVNNTCNNNDRDGIYLQECFSSTVANNTCISNNWGGISLDNSDFSTVANNTYNDNGWDGISLEESDSSIVAKNTCNGNGRTGIFLGSSDNNSIVWNILAGNGAYGIELSVGSDINAIHHNDFIENGQNTSQACDDGWYNQWFDDTVLEGNYWLDYSGTGNYSIDGLARAVDPYPSLSPYRYSRETDRSYSPAFPQDVLVRIGLFLVVIGFFVVVLFVNRRKISS
ncbi:MAG: NosD domain-containing protein [Candidatus Hermodarchaeota archaeon]